VTAQPVSPRSPSAGRPEPLERLETLCDPDSLELLAPADDAVGVRVARGRVGGRPIVCYAMDSRVAGGSVGVAEADAIVRGLRHSGQAGVPLVAFLESAGARLQEGAAALGGFGRIFSANVALCDRVPQISVITGTSAGGGCYSPALTDFVIMTREAAMFLTGPGVVREVMGEDVGAAELGGTGVHERNGVCHCVAEDSAGAIALARDLLAYLPQSAWSLPEPGVPEPPAAEDPGAVVPSDQRRVYDVREVMDALVDAGRHVEIAPRWARNIVCAFARIEGRPVGVVANQPRMLGGVLDADSATKAARFVRTCDAYGLPLIVLVDTPGFLPGTRQERGGVIRHGAKLLHAFAEATVPRLTVVLRKAYGGAYITMNSKDLGAHFSFAWPSATC